MYTTKKKTRKKVSIGQWILYLILTIYALACLLPMLLVVVASFSTDASIAEKGFSFFPTGWTTKGYQMILHTMEQLVRAYGVTLFETITGSVWMILLGSMCGYALSRRSFRLRSGLTVFLLIPMLFHGGGLSEYVIRSNVYHLRNNLLVLILPGVSAYCCFVMRNFIQDNVPESLVESAKIDGAREFYIYGRVVLPLIKPILAALGFMTAIEHWNQWQISLLYISEPKLATLQQLLMKIENSLVALKGSSQSAEMIKAWMDMPKTATRMAVLVVATGPILIAYPFFQKYFIKGITVGAVKG